jgi:hypothetical protein
LPHLLSLYTLKPFEKQAFLRKNKQCLSALFLINRSAVRPAFSPFYPVSFSFMPALPPREPQAALDLFAMFRAKAGGEKAVAPFRRN